MNEPIEIKHEISFDPMNFYYPPAQVIYHASHQDGGYKMTKEDIRKDWWDMAVDVFVHLLLGILYVVAATCYAVSFALWIQLLK